MPQLSVIVITKNAAADIDRCLASVAWADELIVLDSGSTDDTVARCQKYTAQVFSTDWPGFGAQKNRALAKATGDWVLSLDADEYVSEALRDEIKQQCNHRFTALILYRENPVFVANLFTMVAGALTASCVYLKENTANLAMTWCMKSSSHKEISANYPHHYFTILIKRSMMP